MNARFFALALFYFAAHLSRGLSISPAERIMEGSNTDIESVPYMLSFMVNGEYKCCAAIINEDWAVTAAHCVNAAEDPNEISVSSGSSVLYEAGAVHNVIDALVHEKYNDENKDFDIAVIKVKPPFTFDNSTKAVDLAQNDAENITTEHGVVCGWGYYVKVNDVIDPVLPKYLQCVKIPLIEKSQCAADYKDRFVLTPRMTCYGFQEGFIDACKGDSGGALVNRDNILLGITSWGDGCAETFSPGVYTNAIVLGDWIRNKTGTST